MKPTALCSAIATAAFLTGLLVTAGAQTPGFTRTVLQRGDLSIAGREAVSVVAELQPGVQSGRHTHPGEEVSYVMAGPIVIEIDGTPAKTYQTGEALIIPAGVIHNARNSSSNVVKLVNAYIVEKGKPLSTPVTP